MGSARGGGLLNLVSQQHRDWDRDTGAGKARANQESPEQWTTFVCEFNASLHVCYGSYRL